MRARNPYLVTRALKIFMWSSILASVSSQLATTTNAIVVSNLIGKAAISAINLMTPILTLFTCLMILFGIGASIIASKAIGRRDDDMANGVFTSSIISAAVSGVVLAVIVYIFSPVIVEVLTGGNPEIYPLALDYLQAMCMAVPFMMMAGVVENFAKTDGNPRMVMIAVICGSVLNLVLDIVFVKWLNLGIAGSAWASGLNYLLAIIICSFHFRLPNNSLKWKADWKKMREYVNKSFVQGLPMSINTLLLGGSVMFINYIVLYAQGSAGIYCWSVCLQLFMILQMVLTGIDSGIYSMGGLLVGEEDMEGLTILNRKSILYTAGTLVVITAIILIFPQFFGQLFGMERRNPVTILPHAIRTFSLILVPYALVNLLKSTYQILGRTPLSLFLSITQIVLMLGCVFGFSFISSDMLWWGFPISSFILLTGLSVYTWILHLKDKSLRPFTLIPQTENHDSINFSVKISDKSVDEADEEINGFLREHNVKSDLINKILVNCDELMENIVKHAFDRNKEKHYFDIHVRINEREINVLIKDDGRPFNPILPSEKIKIDDNDTEESRKLKLVNATTDKINYKYMYDQNMVMLDFER